MRRRLLAALSVPLLAAVLYAVTAGAQTFTVQPPAFALYEGAVTTTPAAMWIVTGTSSLGAPAFERIFNATVQGPTLWCSRYTAPGAAHPVPGAGLPGSYPIASGTAEKFDRMSGFVPPGPTWCASDPAGARTVSVVVEVY